MNEMSNTQRDRFLQEVRVAVLAIERTDKAPLCAPVWYRYVNDSFQVSMEGDSAKSLLLQRAGRASICIQDESPPYKYVTAEGHVTVEALGGQTRYELVLELASRYLGDEDGVRYAKGYPPDRDGGVLVTLHPHRWQTTMY